MMYPHKRPLKPEKVVSKPVNIGNLINQKIQQRQRNNENTPKNPFLKKSPLTLNSGVMEIILQNKQKDTRSLRQYVQILEEKQKRQEFDIKELKRKSNQFVVKDQFDNILKQSYYYGLEQYYTQSRKIMVEICYELVDCKGIFMSYTESSKFKTRIQAVTKLMTKIQVFMKTSNVTVNKVPSHEQQQRTTIKQLQSVIQIQEKSIMHLKQMSKYPAQQCFQQEKRLLRYQINRLFAQNQKLKQACGFTYSEFIARLKSKDFENERILLNQTIKEYFDMMNNQLKMKDIEYRHKVEKQFVQNRLEQEKEVMKDLEIENQRIKRQNIKIIGERKILEQEIKMVTQQNLNHKIQLRRLVELEKDLRHQNQKFSVQNQKLLSQSAKLEQQMSILKNDILKTTTEVNHQKSLYTASQHQKSTREAQLEQQLNDLKQRLIVTQVLLEQSNSRLKESKQEQNHPDQQNPQVSNFMKKSNPNLHSIKSFQHTFDEKILFLEEYLREYCEDYYLIFRQFKRKLEQAIIELKVQLERQNEEKQMIMCWCKKVYMLLKQSDIPGEIIQQHLQELEQLNKSKKIKGPKINKLLECVKECSNGLDKHQQKEIEQELEQYIVTLKKRADVIQEVENEDGSSVATLTDFRSQAFTDFEDRLSDIND